MAYDIKFLLWLLLLSSSPLCFGSELDIQCLKGVLQSVSDPKGILKSSWNFDNSSYGFVCGFTGVECWNPDENRVIALRLSNLGLGGQFPRGPENCNSMVGLGLSSNDFSGPIPFDVLGQVPFLAFLDLSYNSFSSEIPVSIISMTYLNILYLQHNQLSGQIPGQFNLLSRLTSFSVAYNQLSGHIPSLLGEKFPSASFTGNPELCGGPLGDCVSKRKWRLSRINDESSMLPGLLWGVVVAFYFPRLFVRSRKLQPYMVRIR